MLGMAYPGPRILYFEVNQEIGSNGAGLEGQSKSARRQGYIDSLWSSAKTHCGQWETFHWFPRPLDQAFYWKFQFWGSSLFLYIYTETWQPVKSVFCLALNIDTLCLRKNLAETRSFHASDLGSISSLHNLSVAYETLLNNKDCKWHWIINTSELKKWNPECQSSGSQPSATYSGPHSTLLGESSHHSHCACVHLEVQLHRACRARSQGRACTVLMEWGNPRAPVVQ